MSQWKQYEDGNIYFLIVDSKPAETVDQTNLNNIFCSALVNTASCIKGARKADLPWFKQYNECESPGESKQVITERIKVVLEDNFLEGLLLFDFII